MCCPPVQTICNDFMTRELVTAEQLQRETDYYRANDLHSLAMSVAGHVAMCCRCALLPSFCSCLGVWGGERGGGQREETRGGGMQHVRAARETDWSGVAGEE